MCRAASQSLSPDRRRCSRTALPPGAETSVVNDDFGDVYGLYYAVTGDGFSEKELLDYAQTLRQRLLAVEDVAKVAIGGEQPEAIFVEISRDKARAFGLSINQIFQDLSQQNSVVAAGDLMVDGRRMKITPTGEADSVSALENIIILCGHYKGVDQRVRDLFITKEITIGDYVLSGGELAAAVLADSIIRLIPGVLNDETSALTDSFQDDLLAPPVYTRPADYEGHKVPDILLSGDPNKVENWRMEQAEKRTKERRPDILKND